MDNPAPLTDYQRTLLRWAFDTMTRDPSVGAPDHFFEIAGDDLRDHRDEIADLDRRGFLKRYRWPVYGPRGKWEQVSDRGFLVTAAGWEEGRLLNVE